MAAGVPRAGYLHLALRIVVRASPEFHPQSVIPGGKLPSSTTAAKMAVAPLQAGATN